jgi:hypothetical protein
MISSILLLGLFQVITFIASPILNQADVTLDNNIATSIASASNYLNTLDKIFPVSTVLAIFTLFLIIEGVILGYKVVMWIMRKIPGIN